MDIDLNAIKTYCRIDGDEEDALLLTLIDAAKVYLDGAGVPEPPGDDPLYLLAVEAMTLQFYDSRGMTQAGTPAEIPGMRHTITQLKLRAETARIVEGGV